jgi:DNA-directed RNA polymerase specialized sigma24 family protein
LNSDPQREHFQAAIALRPQCENESLDTALIDILVEQRGYFLRYLQGRLGNRDDAEDIFQDFQLRVLLKGTPPVRAALRS